MKRVELLEALYLQGKKMRELQVYYFSLRKGGGRFRSPEAKKVLAQSKLEELQYDKMVKELDEWWEKHELSDGTGWVLDYARTDKENGNDGLGKSKLKDFGILNDQDDDIRI